MPLCLRSASALLVLGLLAPDLLSAQEPYLVLDINRGTEKERGLASHEVLATTSAGLFYSFDDGIHGPELWRSDTSGANASLLRDLCSGPCGSSPHDFVEVAGAVYFFTGNLELWRTNGTPNGTYLVRDLRGSAAGGPSPRAVGDALFFRARDDHGQTELWTSDGTGAGTRPVTDICSDCTAGIFDLTAFDGRLYFRADDGVHGVEVWSSDGVTASLLGDDCPGACSSGPSSDQPGTFTSAGDDLLYWEVQSGSPRRLRLRSIAGAASEFLALQGIPRLVATENGLVFPLDNALARIELPSLAPALFYPFPQSASLGPLTALGGAVYFGGYDPDHGYELWRSDGTAEGTQLVLDTVPGSTAGSPQNLVAAAGQLFFTTQQGRTLWRSDGTAAGSRRFTNPAYPLPVARLTPDPLGGLLLFTVGDPASRTAELWLAEGPSIGARPARRVSTRAEPGLRALTAFAGSLVFGARSDDSARYQLWRSDGTPGGTAVLSPDAGIPEDAAPYRGGLVFRNGTQVWTTDGTAGGTRLFVPSFIADGLQVTGDRLVLSGFSIRQPGAYTGSELWTSDGTASGTRLIKDIAPGDLSLDGSGPGSSRPRQMTTVGSTLFFVAETPELGAELWSSDGTPAGTALHADLCAGPCSSDLRLLASLDGRLFFTAGPRSDLLSTTPSHNGALRVLRIGGSVPDPVAFRGRLFFFGEDMAGREHLWSTDGTAPGTVRVQEVSGPSQPRTAHEPVVLGESLFFTSWSEAAGQELWVSDGTADGTHLFDEIRPGTESSDPQHLTKAGERLFFSANDGAAGQELWMTDGTAAGTRRVGDIAPGPGSSQPEDLMPSGHHLFFSADDGKTGRELWALDIQDRPAPCVPGADRLCLIGRRFEVAVSFVDPLAGGIARPATAIPDSDQSGFFWFFSPGNLELVVKVLDGRAANGHFWVLFGALSDVKYTVTVTDRATGAVRTYHNPRGTFCGQADTAAFPGPADATASARSVRVDPVLETTAAGSCEPGPAALCLGGGRFRVEARFKDHAGVEGTATAVPRTDESGTFWFFSPGNIELMVKVLDGTPFNGKRWIFYGALSDVEYWLTVTDTGTGAAKTYHNPPGTYCGKGDTAGL